MPTVSSILMSAISNEARPPAAPHTRRDPGGHTADVPPAPAAPVPPPPASAWLSSLFGLDLRSLALLRVGIALCLLIDLAGRLTDLEAHYTDVGVFPRDTAIETSDPWHYSFHLMSGQPIFQAALFAIAAIAASCLLFGLHTRLSCVASWVLLVSLQNRNFIILNGADVLLRMILFWGIFLPLGARFSVDGVLYPPSSPPKKWEFSAATVFYTVQFIIVYVFAGLIKLDVPAWRDGTGLAYALRSPEFASPPVTWIVDNVPLMKVLNDFVVHGELWGSLLLFVPVARTFARVVLVVSFSILHLLIALFLSVGMFPLVAIVAVSVFLPSPFWDRWIVAPARWRARAHEVLRYGNLARETLVARLAKPERTASPRTSALARWLTTAVGATSIVFVVFGNIAAYRPLPFSLSEKLMWITPLLRLEQRWDMFALPMTAGGWFVIPGRLTSGVEIDLYTERAPPSWREPHLVADMFANARWKKYFMNIAAPQFAQHRLHYGRYLCRSWGRTHVGAHNLEAFKIYWMRQAVEPWENPGSAQRNMLWQHECREGLLTKWGSLL